MFDGFPPRAFAFFRGLKANNDRAWFNAHKAHYEVYVKKPMVALCEAVNRRLAGFAVDHVTDPKKAMYRIHRDTRFSNDKTPYKLHLAAMFPHPRLPKNYCAGFYFHVSDAGCEVAAGLYMPDAAQLNAVRQRLIADPAAFERLVTAPALARRFGPLKGDALVRVPKRFADQNWPDAVAARLRLRQYYFDATLPRDATFFPTFVDDIARRFEAAAPAVRWLNETILPLAADGTDDTPRRPAPMF